MTTMTILNNLATTINCPPELLTAIGIAFIGILAVKLLKAIGKLLLSATVIGLIAYAFLYM